MLQKSPFKAPWWLRNNHLQTIWAGKIRRQSITALTQKRIQTPDNDFLDLVITNDNGGPVVLVLHGLQGSIRSPYANGILKTLFDNGYTAVLMHFRACSDEINWLPRLYHSGETGDTQFVINYLKDRFPHRKIAAIGFSIGGNVLLKLLGESRSVSLTAAVAVSVPFSLARCADRINRGMSKIYQNLLIRSMKRTVIKKHKAGQLDGIDIQAVNRAKTFWEFDDRFTAPLHGFQDVHDYYRRSSSRQFLKNIQVPTLILQAIDDPFTSSSAVPEAPELSDRVQLEISKHGGHVGFVYGNWPWKARYWLDERLVAFFNNELREA